MKWNHLKQWIRRFDKPITVLIGATCLTSLLMSLDFSSFEACLYDFRVVQGFQKSPDLGIVLITLDDTTAQNLGGFVPLSLNHHTHLLTLLKQADPKAIGYLVDMNHVQQINPAAFENGGGAAF